MSRVWHIGRAARILAAALAALLLAERFSVARAETRLDPAAAATRIAQAHFAEPLIAMAPTAPAEDKALARALAHFDARRKPEDFSALTGFLARYPRSPWRVALLVNLGLEWKHYGFLSRALDAFEQAWREGKSAAGTYQKPLADRAIGELVLLHTGLGHIDRAKALLAEIGERPVANPGGQWVEAARQTLWVLENDPKHAFLCGPLALKFLMMEDPATTPEQVKFVNRYRASPQGASLAEVARLADEAKVSLTPVFRKPGEAVPVPSVVHWKLGHFAAILGRENGGYRIKDPVLGRDARWIPAEAIEEEASGYFLAPSGEIKKAAWRTVDANEAGQVLGMGPIDDWWRYILGLLGNPPGCGGMCGYNITELGVGVTLSDQPVGYTPAIGPSAKVSISYYQREAAQPAVFNYFNVSTNWTFSWMRFIQDDPSHAGQSVMRYQADGGAWLYTGYSSATGAFAPEEADASVLTLISKTPVIYQRSLQDGSIELYSQSDGATSFPRNVFLTAIIDPQGNALTLSYSTLGGKVRLNALTDATGRKTTFSYGNAASPLLITQITDPFGRSAKLTYDASGRLISITDVIGIISSFTYDSAGLVNALTTPYGTTHFMYGGNGVTRFVNVTDPLGLHEREETLQPAPVPFSDALAPNMNPPPFNAYLNYRDSFHWDKHQYGQAGCTPTGGCNYSNARVTHFYHDAANINIEWYQVESRKEPLETRIWYNYPGQQQNLNNGTYDQPSVVGRIVDGHTSQLWQRTYNTSGNPTQIIDPVGRTTNFTYAANGVDLVQVKQVAGSGTQTIATYTYNAQHRPVTYTDAAGQVTHYAYNKAGQPTAITLPTGLVWSFAYDGLGRLILIANPDGKAQASYTYDALDRVATATDSEGYKLSYAYDAADRLTKITYPDGTTRTYTYNKLDLASVTDRQGHTTTYAYDADRRLIAMTDPLGNVTRYTYWENGKLKSLTDPKGNVTSWSIDLQGRPGIKQYADGTKVTYSYDDSGRLKSVRDALGQVKQYAYTPDNRLARIAYSYATVPTADVTFSYDPSFPRLTSMTDAAGTSLFAYGPIGSPGALQLQSEASPLGTSVYTYDALGRMSARVIAGNGETFQYDKLNRPITHASALGLFIFAYLGESGQMTGRAQISPAHYSAGTSWLYLPNSGDRRLMEIANTGMRQFNFATTPEDLITNTLEPGPSGWAYGYDADYRLINALYSGGLQYGITLDADGNITQLKGKSATSSFTYNNLNELVSEGAAHFTYDANGNLLSDGQRTYYYDPENRLVAIAYTGTGAATFFSYDGLGRRIAIVETAPSKAPVYSFYQWCGSRICRQFGTGGTARLYYDEGEALPASGQTLYYGPDQLGSPRNFAIAKGKTGTVEALDFDPFGNALANPAAPLPDFRFAGMFYHGTSGLYLTKYRAYDPRTARWLSRDRIGEKADFGPTEIGSVSELIFQTILANRPIPTQITGFLAQKAREPWLPPPVTFPLGQSGGTSNLFTYAYSDPVNVIDPAGLDGVVGGLSGVVSGAIIGGYLGAGAGGIGAVPGAIIGGIIGGIGGYGPPEGFHFPWYNPNACPAGSGGGSSSGGGGGQDSGPVMYDPGSGTYVPFNPSTAPVSNR